MRSVLQFPLLAFSAWAVSAHEGPGAPASAHLHAGDVVAPGVAVVAIAVWLWRRAGR